MSLEPWYFWVLCLIALILLCLCIYLARKCYTSTAPTGGLPALNIAKAKEVESDEDRDSPRITRARVQHPPRRSQTVNPFATGARPILKQVQPTERRFAYEGARTRARAGRDRYDQLRWQSSLTDKEKEKEEYLNRQMQKDKKNNKKLKNLVNVVREYEEELKEKLKKEQKQLEALQDLVKQHKEVEERAKSKRN